MASLALRKGEADQPAVQSLLEFHSPTAALGVVQPQRGAKGMTWVVVSLAAACFAAAWGIPTDKVVTAAGKVVAQSATSVVQPLETAIVRSIEVKEGQTVRAGDILARLDPTFAAADAGALVSQVRSLNAEVSRLEAESSGQTYRPADDSPVAVLQGVIFTQRQAERAFKNENYAQRIRSLQSQVARAATDKAAYTDRVRISRNLERMRVELERLAVGSQIARLEAEAQRVEAERGLANAEGQIAQTIGEMQAVAAERDGYNQQWRSQVNQELTEQGRKLSDAREQLNKAQLRRNLVELRAEKDSVVLSIAKVSIGSVLQSGEQFFTLVPLDAPLEVEVNVAGGDAGFVHMNNPVTVKFDTFPFTQYGSAKGRVRLVSADSFTSNPDERQRGAQQQTANAPAFYRARITLDEVNLHDTPASFRVVPGMPVTADVKVGERTVMSYLLSRVLPVAMDGMREP